jgi:hypothetical protein
VIIAFGKDAVLHARPLREAEQRRSTSGNAFEAEPEERPIYARRRAATMERSAHALLRDIRQVLPDDGVENDDSDIGPLRSELGLEPCTGIAGFNVEVEFLRQR